MLALPPSQGVVSLAGHLQPAICNGVPPVRKHGSWRKNLNKRSKRQTESMSRYSTIHLRGVYKSCCHLLRQQLSKYPCVGSWQITGRLLSLDVVFQPAPRSNLLRKASRHQIRNSREIAFKISNQSSKPRSRDNHAAFGNSRLPFRSLLCPAI